MPLADDGWYDPVAIRDLVFGMEGDYWDIAGVWIEGLSTHPSWRKRVTADLAGCIALFRVLGAMTKIPVVEVPPKVWQKEIFGETEKDTKESSFDFVQFAYPETNLHLTPKGNKSKNPNDNYSDAICIAEYGRRTWTPSGSARAWAGAPARRRCSGPG